MGVRVLPRWRLRIAGVVAVTLGVILAVLGDTVLGYRRYTEVHNGIGYPAVKFPIVVARIWVLPYLGGLLTLIGSFLPHSISPTSNIATYPKVADTSLLCAG